MIAAVAPGDTIRDCAGVQWWWRDRLGECKISLCVLTKVLKIRFENICRLYLIYRSSEGKMIE